MSNIISFNTRKPSFRSTAPVYTFYYTKPGTMVNSQGQVIQSMQDTGVSIVLIPDEGMERIGRRKLDKAMIEKFTRLNNGERPSFRMEVPTE